MSVTASRRSELTVAFDTGRTLTCPCYPTDCDWVAVQLEGVEVYRATADAIAREPLAELTAFAEALIPARAHDTDLLQPAGQDPAGWHECGIAAVHNGCTIRFDARPEEVERVRICGPTGEEVGYWVSSEFEEDAADCLGAAVGALVGGEL